jgi:hypothetical protein
MKIFNEWTLLFLSVALFFILKTINDRYYNNTKLYLVDIVLENNPDLSEFELEERVNKLFNIVKSR